MIWQNLYIRITPVLRLQMYLAYICWYAPILFKMETMTAFCGLTCDSCPIHLATLEEDKSLQFTMRESIAKQCSIKYGMILQPGEINDCDGCRSDTARLFSGCWNCEIRKCASQKNIENCAFCKQYACERLKEHFLRDPGSQTQLEEIRHRHILT